MSKIFERYIEDIVPGITKEQVGLIHSTSIVKGVRKKEMLLREGEVSKYKIFVAKGLLRNYSLDNDGNEHIMRFSDAGSWTVDPESYFSGQPSKYYIDAIEPAEVVMFLHDDLEALTQQIPALNEFFLTMITTNMGLIQKRTLMAISATAEEKYIDFINTFPNVFHRVPLHMVASYLGVSRETLTRIRQGLATSVRG